MRDHRSQVRTPVTHSYPDIFFLKIGTFSTGRWVLNDCPFSTGQPVLMELFLVVPGVCKLTWSVAVTADVVAEETSSAEV